MELRIDRRKVTVKEVLKEAKMNGISCKNVRGSIFEFKCKDNPMKVRALQQVFGLEEITSSQETKRKFFRYVCIEDAPKSEHVHYTRVMKGNEYLIAKDDDDRFVRVTGQLENNNGGRMDVIDKSLNKDYIQNYVKLIGKR